MLRTPSPVADISTSGLPTNMRILKSIFFPRSSSAGYGSVIGLFMWNIGYRTGFLSGRMHLPSNLATRGQSKKLIKRHATTARIPHPTVAQKASKAGLVTKRYTDRISTAKKMSFIIKYTFFSRRSQTALQASHSGAPNETVWCLLKTQKKPKLSTLTGRLWATSGELQPLHAYGLRRLLTGFVYRYIVKALNLFLANDEHVHHYQRGRASITGLRL